MLYSAVLFGLRFVLSHLWVMIVMLCSVSRRVSLQKLVEMRDAVQAIVIPSSDVLSEQLQAAMVCSFTANLCGNVKLSETIYETLWNQGTWKSFLEIHRKPFCDDFSILLWVYERTGSMDSQMCTHCSALCCWWYQSWWVEVCRSRCWNAWNASCNSWARNFSWSRHLLATDWTWCRVAEISMVWHTSLKQETIEIWDHFLHDCHILYIY